MPTNYASGEFFPIWADKVPRMGIQSVTMAEKDHQRVIRTLTDAVAATLRAERAAADLTTLALAELSGVPERTLMRILAAERDISVKQIDLLTRALGISSAYVMTEAERRLERAIAEWNAEILRDMSDRAAERIEELRGDDTDDDGDTDGLDVHSDE